MLVIFPVIALVLAQTLWFILGKPRLVAPQSAHAEGPRISLLIPARNEENNLPKLLASIRKSKIQPHEILVIDDGSTDATAAVARAGGASVINPAPLPAEWKGKPWACQEGARHTTGDWLLFLDADVWFEEGGLESVLALANNSKQASSICPYHQIQTPAEELSAFFNLIMVAGSNAFGLPSPTSANDALFGQSLLLPKQSYQKVGGHEAVKGEILENFHLAEHLEEKGVPRRCYLGKGTLSMRMFPSGLQALWPGWKKGFASGARQTSPRALGLISLWLTAGMMTLINLLFLPFGNLPFAAFTLIAYFSYSLQCLWAFRLVGNFSGISAFLFPITLLFYQTLFFTALIEKKRGIQTNWKGRDVH